MIKKQHGVGGVFGIHGARGTPGSTYLENMQITANFEVADLGHVLIVVGLFGPHARHMCERKIHHIFFGVGGIFGIHRARGKRRRALTK